MKRIIDGFRYDTEKATLIGEAEANCYRSDFSWWEAGLYVTPRAKRYFLAGTGGPMTMFSHRVDGNSWSGGSKLIPMDESDAFEWAQRNLEDDEVEEHFGHLIEDA